MIVADASVAAKWLFLEEEHAGQAARLLENTVSRNLPILAPPLLQSEIVNILRQRVRRSAITPDEASALLEEFLELQVIDVDWQSLRHDALVVANELDLPAVYDAQYVVVARAMARDLWTADRRLVRAIDGRLPFVRFLSDYDG